MARALRGSNAATGTTTRKTTVRTTSIGELRKKTVKTGTRIINLTRARI
jgi:hypothetical protein